MESIDKTEYKTRKQKWLSNSYCIMMNSRFGKKDSTDQFIHISCLENIRDTLGFERLKILNSHTDMSQE